MKKRLELVQLIRAVAIIFVLFGHTNTLFDKQFGFDLFNMGVWSRTGGVDLFLVISGLMIYYVYSNKIGIEGAATTFFKKRVFKIIPMYWMVTISAFSIFLIFPSLGNENDGNLSNLFQSLFFINDDPTITVAWSLSHIILFYFAFSLWIATPVLGRSLIILWVVVSFIYIVGLYPFHIVSDFLFSVNNLEILAGVFIGYFAQKYNVKYNNLFITFGSLLFIFVWLDNAYGFLSIDTLIVRPMLYGIASILLLTGIFNIDINKEIKIPKTLSYLGDASYSIFLTHGPFLKFFVLIFSMLGLVNQLGFILSMIITSVLAVISGVIAYRILENPINLFLNKHVSQKNEKSSIGTVS